MTHQVLVQFDNLFLTYFCTVVHQDFFHRMFYHISNNPQEEKMRWKTILMNINSHFTCIWQKIWNIQICEVFLWYIYTCITVPLRPKNKSHGENKNNKGRKYGNNMAWQTNYFLGRSKRFWPDIFIFEQSKREKILVSGKQMKCNSL